MKTIAQGIWPTMLTPFTPTGNIDYEGLNVLVDWYISQGVNGLFAICQSSEMFQLEKQEKLDLASACMEQTAGRVPVIASGNTADTIEEQAEDVIAMAETGVDSVVLLTNRFAASYELDDVWKHNLEQLLARIPDDINLGFYECPYPYKRLLSPETFSWVLSLNRFVFLKDTSCSMEIMRQRISAAEGTSMKIFNANSATLLKSLKAGCAGYSGVMANFHPDLYGWLYSQVADEQQMEKQSEHGCSSELLQAYLGMASVIEQQNYPRNAKYFLSRKGLPISEYCRKEGPPLAPYQKIELEQFLKVEAFMRSQCGISR